MQRTTFQNELTKLQLCIQYFHQVDCWRKYSPSSHAVILYSTRILPEEKLHIFSTTARMHHSTTWNTTKSVSNLPPASKFRLSELLVFQVHVSFVTYCRRILISRITQSAMFM